MWRRLQTLAPSLRCVAATLSSCVRAAPLSTASAAFRHTSPLLSSPGDKLAPTKVEDVMPIATGLEREELEAELQKRFDMDPPVGPFGTKEEPAVIESYYNKRIVGCPGGEGEDEHDVVWFGLEKDKPHECHVCSQYFVLRAIGDRGDPDGHDDDEDEHH
ncbi:hypothetical protein SETIT_3G139900v2 [Setaria italica]|uniref:Cytochrome c oxidase subunit 5b n=1 Tax=Setaria italica TaxID=4555 RepID=A0A368QGR0_SETIT|nr:hypothetical protein SETIT_3G139900v2 [Setaria italica]